MTCYNTSKAMAIQSQKRNRRKIQK